MAGGIFTSQNKVRPGAYINFKATNRAGNGVNDRGIVTMPLALSWGEEGKLIEIKNTDFIEGNLISMIGYNGHEIEVQLIREAFKNAHTVITYRLNKNGAKATAAQDEFNIIAKYPGTVGNRISIQVKAKLKNIFEVNVLLDGKVLEKFEAATVEELAKVNSKYVNFTGTGALTAIAGLNLEGGEDGEVSDENYSDYFKLIKSKRFDVMGLPLVESTEVKEQALVFVKNMREERGRKVQVVLRDYTTANYEGVISIDQGYKTETEIIKQDGFVAYIAGLTAGSAINKSNTYAIIPGATEIINPKDDLEIEEGIKEGMLMLSYSDNGAVRIETDINTLTSYSDSTNEDFSKNRVIRTLDNIHNVAKMKFEEEYIGKVSNNPDGRNVYKTDMLKHLKDLEAMEAISEVIAEDIIISQGDKVDSVVVGMNVKPLDSMEKLYMIINV